MSSEKKSNDDSKSNRKSGSRNNGKGRGNNTNPIAVSKFEGACTKDLAGKIVTYTKNKALMGAQYIKFESAVYDAAGNTDPALTLAIDAKRVLLLKDFVAGRSLNKEDYTTLNADGTSTVDEDLKKIYKAADSLMTKSAVEAYSTYLKNADMFFYKIKLQICPETITRMKVSDRWPEIEKNRDAGGLMELLQTICVHGTDRDYFPERLINSIVTLFGTKQGKQTPNEFKASMTSNLNVLAQVAGVDLFTLIPNLQKFVINKCDDIAYEHSDLAVQSSEDKKILANKCVDCIIGCNMTMKSNKEKSDMYQEVHKNLLSKNGDAFAMSGSEAVDQMIGFEEIKRPSSKGGDTSSAPVLFGISEENGPVTGTRTIATDSATHSREFRCYNCGEPGHSQYKCPELTQKERSNRYEKDYQEQSTGEAGAMTKEKLVTPAGGKPAKDKKDAVGKAVLFHLGQELHNNDDASDEEEDDNTADGDDRFMFCQLTDFNTESDRDDLIQVLTRVAQDQRKTKPDGWANAVAYKLSLVGVTSIAKLVDSLPHLNATLSRMGLSTMHSTTLLGLSAETARFPTAAEDFRTGHA